MTADAFTVGAYVRGATNAPRLLCSHADLFTAFADGVMVDRDATGEAYLSHYCFGPDYRAHHAAHLGSVAGFTGPCWCRWVVFDIDRPDPTTALADARKLVAFIHQRYPELEGEVPIYFSGSKGYHVLLELAHRPPPAVGFHRTAKTMAEAVATVAGVDIDRNVYDLAHIIRLPNTRHPKTGLYKRRIDADALFRLDVDRIRDHARQPAGDGIPTASRVPEELSRDWEEAERHAGRATETRVLRRNESGGSPDLRAPKFFLDLLRFGVQEGERHQTLFRAAAWLTEQGAPPVLVSALLTEPGCDVGLTPKDVERQISCGIEHAGRQRGVTPPHSQLPASVPSSTSSPWKCPDAFFDLTSSRGWNWHQVLAWLKLGPDTGYFNIPTDQRQAVAEHLERLPKKPKRWEAR